VKFRWCTLDRKVRAVFGGFVGAQASRAGRTSRPSRRRQRPVGIEWPRGQALPKDDGAGSGEDAGGTGDWASPWYEVDVLDGPGPQRVQSRFDARGWSPVEWVVMATLLEAGVARGQRWWCHADDGLVVDADMEPAVHAVWSQPPDEVEDRPELQLADEDVVGHVVELRALQCGGSCGGRDVMLNRAIVPCLPLGRTFCGLGRTSPGQGRTFCRRSLQELSDAVPPLGWPLAVAVLAHALPAPAREAGVARCLARERRTLPRVSLCTWR
jgi:hypothetical protein